MALFFDKAWFDTRLSVLGLSRADLAAYAGLSDDDVTLILKDQMEVTAHHVQAWASLLGVDGAEIALRCGVSTPFRSAPSEAEKVAALEAQVAGLQQQIQTLSKPPSAHW